MAKDELVVAAVQLNSQQDVAHNLQTCRQLAERAARRGAELLLLPENFAFFGPEAGKRNVAESLSDGPIATALADMARELGLCVVGGGFPERSADAQRPHNTLLVVGPDGSQLATYTQVPEITIGTAGGGGPTLDQMLRGGQSVIDGVKSPFGF